MVNRKTPTGNAAAGTKNASVYLVSPEVAVASAIKGVITDPRTLGDYPSIEMPTEFRVDDSMILAPSTVSESESVDIRRGPNIAPLPIAEPLPATLGGSVLIKLGDNITTDDITPAGTWLKYRSNVPKYSESVFAAINPTFHEETKAAGGGFVIGGDNYGQGSSREHAALCPMYLGIKAVVAKSFARIHKDNLVNFGILPLTFANGADYDAIDAGDDLEFTGLAEALRNGSETVTVTNKTKGADITLEHGYTQRQIDTILAGGKLNYTKSQAVYAV